MKKLSLLTAGVLTAACSLAAENLLTNGGFENGRNAKDVPGFDWIHPGKQHLYEVDAAVKHSGNKSLKISKVEKTYIPFKTKSIKVADFNRPLMIRGWAKYENLVDRDADGKTCGMPFIGIWATNVAGRNSLSINIPVFAEGSRDWFSFERIFTPEEFQKRSAHLVGDNAPQTFAFRINVANQPGTVWFDDLEYFWVDPEALTAALPIKDVTGAAITLDLTVGEIVKDGKIAVAIDGKEVLSELPVKTGKSQISVKLDGVADGKHQLAVKPVAGFPREAGDITLDFTKQPDAFAE